MNPPLKHSIIALILTVGTAVAAAAAAPAAGTAPLPGAALPTARSAPTIVTNVHGYTLVGTKLEPFSALAFEAGKILEIGDAAALRSKYAKARVIDGHGRTLLPGLIDAHGHVLDLGLESVQVS